MAHYITKKLEFLSLDTYAPTSARLHHSQFSKTLGLVKKCDPKHPKQKRGFAPNEMQLAFLPSVSLSSSMSLCGSFFLSLYLVFLSVSMSCLSLCLYVLSSSVSISCLSFGLYILPFSLYTYLIVSLFDCLYLSVYLYVLSVCMSCLSFYGHV